MNTTTTTLAPVALVCSECGIGNYRRSALTDRVRCEHCDHHIYSGDVVLGAGEVLTWTDGPRGALAYIPAADACEHEHVRQVSEYDVECLDCGVIGA